MTQAPTPTRRNIQWRFEAWAYDFAQFLARLFPIDAVSDFGAWLFRSFGPLTGPHRTALTNLRIVFPEATQAELAALLRAQWEETGRWIAEFPTLDRIIADPTRVEVVGAERLSEIAAGKPVVFISGHFSSFEIMSAVIVHSGVISQITYSY